MENSRISRYDDIIDMERPRHDGDDFSRRHPPMPPEERAKIFLPFAALKGYEDTIAERETIYQRENGVSEDMAEEINHRMQEIQTLLSEGRQPLVRVRCFLHSDSAPEGLGNEAWIQEKCTGISELHQTLELTGHSVPFSNLREIQILEST